ncbi:Dorsal-ventral patterning tolloid-like protein 1 [Nymphon striatum]|nr:Dorsal-ventral patterning tolloid-like protein 1 [Nymphon striatum]
MVEELRTASSKVGLEINLSKTKVMFNRNIEIQPIMTGNVALDQVDRYIYLGQLISIHREWEPEIIQNRTVDGRITFEKRIPDEHFLDINPSWLFEGDIALPSADRMIVTNASKLWPNHNVPFIYDSSLSFLDQRRIRSGIKEWTTKTCITFTDKTKNYNFKRSNNHVLFQSSEDGCWSHVGQTGGQQPLNIVKRCEKPEIIVHLIGHLLGFGHEQSRSDRDDYITILTNNIKSDRIGEFNKLTSNDYGVPIGSAKSDIELRILESIHIYKKRPSPNDTVTEGANEISKATSKVHNDLGKQIIVKGEADNGNKNITDWSLEKEFFLALDEQCLRLTRDGWEDVYRLKSCQEEADSRMILHTKDIAAQGIASITYSNPQYKVNTIRSIDPRYQYVMGSGEELSFRDVKTAMMAYCVG